MKKHVYENLDKEVKFSFEGLIKDMNRTRKENNRLRKEVKEVEDFRAMGGYFDYLQVSHAVFEIENVKRYLNQIKEVSGLRDDIKLCLSDLSRSLERLTKVLDLKEGRKR